MAREFVVKKTLHILTEDDVDADVLAEALNLEEDNNAGVIFEVTTTSEDGGIEKIADYTVEDYNIEVIDKQAKLAELEQELSKQTEKATIVVEDGKVEKRTQVEEFVIGILDPIFIDRYNVEFGSNAIFKDNQIVVLAKHLRVGVPIEIGFTLPTTRHEILNQILKKVIETPELNITAVRET